MKAIPYAYHLTWKRCNQTQADWVSIVLTAALVVLVIVTLAHQL